jgi:predicted deacylase
MQIRETHIAPGEHQTVKLPVGQLPSGTSVSMTAHVFRAREPGPTLLLTGGIHGDEINGVEIVREAITNGYFQELERGAVIAVPVVNLYGFINFSREVPDGKDVNRSFPGSARGSLAARVAHTLHKHLLPLVSFGLDFHTGGSSNYNYPQIRYTAQHEGSRELALAFGAPYTIAYKPISKSLRKVAWDRHEVPVLVFEGGENLRYDGLSIQKGLEGIRRVLGHYDMISATFARPHTVHFTRSRWLRAPRGGLFQWLKCSGNAVCKDEPLGFITDPHGLKAPRYLKAPNAGVIIGHNNTPVVSQGDALFHIAVE